MISRKQGPPVPPRPVILANKLSNERDDGSPMPPIVNGRTVIYKSPSYDNIGNRDDSLKYKNSSSTSTSQQKFLMMMMMNNSNSKSNSNSNQVEHYKNNDNENNKSEIVIVNNNNNSNHPNNKTPIAYPRQITSLPKSPTLSTSSIVIKNNHNTSLHQNVIEISNNNLADHSTNNNDIVIINSASQSPQIEIKNNKINSMTTEIIINNHHVIERENCLHNISTPIHLSHRPEPEGGEILINELTNNSIFSNNNTSSILKTSKSMSSIPGISDKKVAFHELLISELTEMRKNENKNEKNHNNFLKLSNSIETSPNGTQRTRIRTSDWVEMGDNGKEVVLSSCQISLEDSGLEDEERIDDASSGVGDSWDSIKDTEERSRMSLPGLPPLPKSLSGIELAGLQHLHNSTPTFGASNESLRGLSPNPQRMPSTLDTQLAILRREMFGLRQLDLSLLSQLWALNESIQDFRSMLQEQETLSPPSPSPTPSDVASVSSDDDDDDVMSLETPIPSRMRQAPPPPPPTRKTPSRPV